VAYRRNYNRPYYGARSVTDAVPKTDGFASEKQRAFALRLVADIEAAEPGLPADLATAVGAMIAGIDGLATVLSDNVADDGTPAWRTVPTRQMSTVIDGLKAVSTLVANYKPADPALAAVGQHDRAMVTRFDGKCHRCGERTTAGTDWAVQAGGAWKAWCRDCASGATAAKQDDLAAQQEADRAASALAHQQAEQVFGAVGTNVLNGNAVRFAVPGDDGALRFYILKAGKRRFFMVQIVGGHAPQPVTVERHRQVLADLCFIGDEGIRAAVVRYGKEIGECGICGRTLTDEESRAAGIGPVCAGRW